mgnify:CR=1 FL=1
MWDTYSLGVRSLGVRTGGDDEGVQNASVRAAQRISRDHVKR